MAESTTLARVSSVCAALGDPTRAAMVERLSRGPASISDLAAPHAMTLTAARKHVGVLVDAGWVERRKAGRVVTCRLRPEPLGMLEEWLTDRRRFWSAALDRLDTALVADHASHHDSGNDSGNERAPR